MRVVNSFFIIVRLESDTFRSICPIAWVWRVKCCSSIVQVTALFKVPAACQSGGHRRRRHRSPLDDPLQAIGNVPCLLVLLDHFAQQVGVAPQGPAVADDLCGQGPLCGLALLKVMSTA